MHITFFGFLLFLSLSSPDLDAKCAGTLTFGVGSIKLSFRSIVLKQYMYAKMFSIQMLLYTFQSNCAEGLHFSAFYYNINYTTGRDIKRKRIRKSIRKKEATTSKAAQRRDRGRGGGERGQERRRERGGAHERKERKRGGRDRKRRGGGGRRGGGMRDSCT